MSLREEFKEKFDFEYCTPTCCEQFIYDFCLKNRLDCQKEYLLRKVEEVEDKLNQERQAKEELLRALNYLEIDNHYWGTRPCLTCQGITDLIGKPFGCVKKKSQTHRKG